ncbi:MAG: hypothetical protein ACQET5_11870 [Halobacteriota archaeon]|uniref:hypothetical protein n=1 Tax=Natronomonas sp. TaxID=2184060 RepID=UPI0039755ED0
MSVDRAATDDGVTVVVENAAAETAVPIELGLDGPDVDDPAVTLVGLRFVTLEELSRFEVTVERPSDIPDNISSPPSVTAMWYVEMNATVDDDDVDNVSFRLRLAEDRLPDETEPDDVQVLQFDGDGWTPVPTTYENGVHNASTDGFQSFAIAVPDAGGVTVVDAEVPTDRVRQGETTTARATLENTAGTNVTETVTVAIDGDAVATQEVELPPGETDVEIDFEAVAGGVVTVNGFEAGEIRTGTPSGTSQEDTSGDEESSGGTFWLLPLILALIALTVGVWFTVTELDTDQL